MLPDLSRLALRAAAATGGFVTLAEGDRRRFDDDKKEIPRLDSVDLEPIPANVERFEMPVDLNKPEGVKEYFNPETVWRAALANPLKAPLRPLLLEEWEELKEKYGDAASDEDKRKMRRAERCLERYWASAPGEDVVCGSEDGSGSEDDEDVPSDPEERFAHLLAAGDPAAVAAGSLEKLREWNAWVTAPGVSAEARPGFEEQTQRRIEDDARARGTFPDAWVGLHPAMLREVQAAMLWIMDSPSEGEEGEEEGEEDEDYSEPDDPDDPNAWYELQVNDENFIVQSFGGWEAFLRATWRLLPDLPESAVDGAVVDTVNGAVVDTVLDDARARRIYNYIRDTYTDEDIVSMAREALNDLVTLFPYLFILVVYRMAETDAERHNVAQVMEARRVRLREEAGAAGAAGPSSSSAAGPSSAAPGARRRALDEGDEASETQGQRQRRRRGDQPP